MASFVKPEVHAGVAPNLKTSAVNAESMIKQANAQDTAAVQAEVKAAEEGTVVYTKAGEGIFNTVTEGYTKINFKGGKYLVAAEDLDREDKMKCLDAFVARKILTKEIV